MAPASAPAAHASSSASSSSSSSSHRPTPPGTSDDSEAALERELDLDHPEPDVDVEWGEETDGQRGIRLQPLGGRSRHSSNRYEDGDDDEEDDGEGEEKRFLPGRRADTVQDYELYTPDEERAVLKRLDRRLVLFMGLLYMLSFLDRSNIGNAKVAGMSRDLNLSSNQYEWLLTAFYVTYIVFEWMTLMYRLVPPHIYIPICVFSWGLLASLQSLSTSFTSLLVLRALLGVSEAAFGPGVPFYLSFFFRRDELAFRTGLFISAAPLSTSFASKRDEGAGQTDEEGIRMRSSGAVKKGVDFREVLKTLTDPKCYLTALMFFACNIAFSSVPVFLPTIIQEMGHSALTSQALSAPPYLVAFASVLLTAHASDRSRARSPYLIFHACLAASSFALIAALGARAATSPAASTPHRNIAHTLRYAALYPATAGFFSAVTLIIAWTLNNQRSASGRGAGLAVLNVVGQCGPLVGTRLFPAADAPYYARGMGACAGCMAGVGVLAAVLRWVLARENARRVGEEEDGAVPLVGRAGEGRRGGFLFML
ncbi:High-affinity nicotinic acid transporter [Neofusicoccum parvum]|uniref:High-affinity nicotinic acid transporter n=1 Tax=Neofusicoccum parvum TaxID=310453 RepID=A0ACB5S347_9PEZI|nr:High-affinity nicotinic acid transporter [Neofusicoccum parvum]